jgi:two-component system, LuxR family, response regulator FixJ
MKKSHKASEGVILLIDDDPAMRSSLKFLLEIEGFTVRVYPRADKLLKEADLPTKGCLIIDYHMPEMDGLKLLEKLRDRGVTIPAIVITTHPSRKLRERIAAAGMPLVEKPFLAEVLLDHIRAARTGPNAR